MKNIMTIILTVCLCTTATWVHGQTVCPENQRTNSFTFPEVSVYPPEFGPPVNPPPTSNPAPEDTARMVFFIHGLGGSPESWTKVRTATEDGSPGFPGRKVIANSLDYNGHLGDLPGAATEIYNLVDNLVGDQDSFQRTRNYFIAHSQGGMVSRGVDKRTEDLGHAFAKDYGGIVTFGTPHQGAYIGNSLMDEVEGNETRVQKWIYDGCRKVGAAAIHDKITMPLNLPIVGINLGNISVEDLTDVSNLTDSVCGFVDLLFQIVPDFNALAKPILADYKDGGSQISVLNSHDANSPNPVQKVAFYGIKGDKDMNGDPQSIFWRTAQWFLINPGEVPIFQANADYQVEESIKKWITNFEMNAAGAHANYKVNKNIHKNSLGVFGWDNKVKWRAIRDDSYAAAYWLRGAENTWLDLIGARYWEEGPTEECYCRYLKDGNPITNWEPTGIFGVSGCESLEDENDISLERECELREAIHPLIKQKPSDGVVLVESAANYPGTTEETRKKMLNTSHMQMRNNGELKKGLLLLYNGDLGDFFILDPK